MIVGVVKESHRDERRVALVPGVLPTLTGRKHSILLERGAGASAGYLDEAYQNKGAELLQTRSEVLGRAQVLLQVHSCPPDEADGAADLAALQPGQVLIGLMDPLGQPQRLRRLAERQVTAFALELMPRVTRAQSMDVLSSMANLAGYKAVLLAANRLPKMFPMMMTAAGTIAPAKVLVLGAGVAGLQAIATAKRLGAVVEAYDIRPEVKEQVASVGGKFVELPLETEQAGDAGGYAKSQSKAFYEKQQELLAKHVRGADVVVTTAAIPGKRAPVLVRAGMVAGMRPGSVLVDLAAETGGNCELTKPGENIEVHGVTIMGPVLLPSSLAFHASQLYAKNITTFLAHLSSADGQLSVDLDDEITRESLVIQDGRIVHPRVERALEG